MSQQNLPDDRSTEPPVAIIGAGPAGAAVSEVLGGVGIAHIVYDEAARSGGNIHRQRFDAPPAALERPGPAARRLETGVQVVGILPPDRVEILRDGGFEQRRHAAIFLCTGAYDGHLPIAGRSPRWASAGALQALLKGQGVVPEGRVVLAGAGPFLHVVAADLRRAGADVAAILDALPLGAYLGLLPLGLAQPGSTGGFLAGLARLAAAGIRPRFGARIAAIEAAELRLASGERIAFDQLGISDFFVPQTQLARSAGCRLDYSPAGHCFAVATDGDGRTSLPGIFACGEAQGVRGAEHAALSGRIAALAYLAERGVAAGPTQALRRRRDRLARFGAALEAAMARHARPIADAALACHCESVPAGRIREAIGLGLAELSDIKVVTRAGMGNCQGRYCEGNLCRLLAEAGRIPHLPLSQKALVRPVLAGDLAAQADTPIARGHHG